MLSIYIYMILSLVGAVLVAPGLASGYWVLLAGLGLFFAFFLGISLAVCLLLFGSAMFVNLNREQKKRSAWFSFIGSRFIEVGLFFARVRVHCKGLELVPRGEKFLLVSNHIYDFDPVFFLHLMPWAKLGFISKKENYRIFGINKIMHALHCLPVDRENDRAALKSILKAAELLKTGDHSMAVFPEGYESRSGKLLPFRNGAFKIAQRAQVPVVVAVLRGTTHIPKNMFRRPTDVSVEILGVIPADELCKVPTKVVGDRAHQMMEEALEREGAV